MSGALAGIRVLDTSSLAPGGYATLLLAQAGAEVIKIERPDGGDPARAMPVAADGTDPFQTLNRGKKSVVIDLKTNAGRAAFERLVATCDVVVENYMPRTAERLGVTYERLRAVNESVVLCSITGYAADGPHADRPGHDLNFLARSGALGFLQPASAPDAVPTLPVSDIQGGTAAAFAVTAALFRRATTGEGDHVRIALSDSLVHGWVALGLDAAQQGSAGFDASRPAYAIYRTLDGLRLAVAVEERRFWRAFCAAIGRPDLAEAEHMSTGAGGDALRAEVAAIIAQQPLAHWLETLAETAPVTDVADAGEALRRWSAGSDAGRALYESRAPATTGDPAAPHLGEHDPEFLIAR